MTRKAFAAVLLGVLLTLAAACGGSAPSASQAPASSSTAAPAPSRPLVKVTLYTNAFITDEERNQ